MEPERLDFPRDADIYVPANSPALAPALFPSSKFEIYETATRLDARNFSYDIISWLRKRKRVH